MRHFHRDNFVVEKLVPDTALRARETFTPHASQTQTQSAEPAEEPTRRVLSGLEGPIWIPAPIAVPVPFLFDRRIATDSSASASC